jgi:hypothetical protein
MGDNHLVAIRYKGQEEAQAIVDYLNGVDKNNEYYYESK